MYFFKSGILGGGVVSSPVAPI